jgi:hypothetical protein
MQENFESIKNKSIWNVAIPGTHGSGAFSSDNTIGVRNQDQTIKQQLEGGIRAFDIRVHYVEKKDVYLMAHNNIWANSQKLFDAMDQVWDFTAANTREIVIIKLSYEGNDSENKLNPTRRRYVLQRVKEILRRGDSGMVPYGNLPTDNYLVKDLVSTNRRIIVLNDFPERPEFQNYFWDLNDRNAFYDTYTSDVDSGTIGEKEKKLRAHLPKEVGDRRSHPRLFWASCNLWSINIRDAAINYQHPVAREFLRKCAADSTLKANCNIFGIDFYEVSDYVNLVIALNGPALFSDSSLDESDGLLAPLNTVTAPEGDGDTIFSLEYGRKKASEVGADFDRYEAELRDTGNLSDASVEELRQKGICSEIENYLTWYKLENGL